MSTTDVEKLNKHTVTRAGNRRRMLMAGLKLMERTGNYRLTAQEVVQAAHMHPRSFHMIFGDVGSYYEALITEHGASINELIKRDVKENDKPLARLVLCGR